MHHFLKKFKIPFFLPIFQVKFILPHFCYYVSISRAIMLIALNRVRERKKKERERENKREERERGREKSLFEYLKRSWLQYSFVTYLEVQTNEQKIIHTMYVMLEPLSGNQYCLVFLIFCCCCFYSFLFDWHCSRTRVTYRLLENSQIIMNFVLVWKLILFDDPMFIVLSLFVKFFLFWNNWTVRYVNGNVL